MNVRPKKIEQWNFLSDVTDFHCFLKVDKNFRGLPIVEIGFSGLSIVEVSFHSFSINHINFLGFTFKETSFHALHLCEIVSQGEPVSEMVLVFLHHWWSQFPWILLRRNKLHELSFDDIQFDWLQINLISFHWLFSNRNDTHGFLINETDFWGNLIHEFFPRNSLWQKLVSWNSIRSKLFFFRYSSLKLNFRQFPVDGVILYTFSMEDINFRGFPVHEAHFRGFLLNGNKFLGFSRMKLISIDFHSTSFLLHGVTNADMFFHFHGFLNTYNWLPCFIQWVFYMDFLKKIKLTCLSRRWIWFRCVSLSMISVFFLRFLSLKKFSWIFTWRFVSLTEFLLEKMTPTVFQSIDRFNLWKLQRFSYNNRQRKLVIGRSYQQRIFHEHFSNEDCGIGSFQIISIFITFWSLTKISEDCQWINLVDFLSTEPFSLHCVRVKWSPLAFPVSEVVFFHPC